MATKVDIAKKSITASQMKEFWSQASTEGGRTNRGSFQLYLEGRNPFPLERNEHGHVVITFQGLDLTGAQEIERLEEGKYYLGKYVKQCFLSTKPDSYDAHHRLVVGRVYKIALMPGGEIEKSSDRTALNLRKRGMEHYGYGKPLAGHLPRIREKVDDAQMEEMGMWYIASLHDPIEDSDGNPDVLRAHRDGGGRGVGTFWGNPSPQWFDRGCFAFPVSSVSP